MDSSGNDQVANASETAMNLQPSLDSSDSNSDSDNTDDDYSGTPEDASN